MVSHYGIPGVVLADVLLDRLLHTVWRVDVSNANREITPAQHRNCLAGLPEVTLCIVLTRTGVLPHISGNCEAEWLIGTGRVFVTHSA